MLARKWRPKFFEDMLGQALIVQALQNALRQNRLHHAYLFTGTRGVGKTTLARVFAKGLNCEKGVMPEPCGVCSICREIDQGTFADLLEIDAASRTKVDDTREILDNIQYLPSRGRYKIYLIDEVHMLSTHSFNALLKTLEEPPAHVKFLLATTDPQKIPSTVLSRCIQFVLRSLSEDQIKQHLAMVLSKETILFDEEALTLLARAASGSVRDALSLTDQAIALGAGIVHFDEVRAMLGGADREQVIELLTAVFSGDLNVALEIVHQFSQKSVDFLKLTDEALEILHRISLLQVVKSVPTSFSGEALLQLLAAEVSPEDLQSIYQSALFAKRDMPYAPSSRAAFEMFLIRMSLFSVGVKKKVLKQAQIELVVVKPLLVEAEAPHLEVHAIGLSLAEEWVVWVSALTLEAGLQSIAEHLALSEINEGVWRFILAPKYAVLWDKGRSEKIKIALKNWCFQQNNCFNHMEVEIREDKVLLSPYLQREVLRQEKSKRIVTVLQDEPFIAEIVKRFAVSWDESSIIFH